MMRVVILRRDGTSDVERKVKHLIFRERVMTLYMGEHGKDRVTEHWPLDVIDHVRIFELETPHAETPERGGANL